jgi:hypothetical protein
MSHPDGSEATSRYVISFTKDLLNIINISVAGSLPPFYFFGRNCHQSHSQVRCLLVDGETLWARRCHVF